MVKNPPVSIIISHYNLHDFVEEAILSCLNQTYKNIEIIVVDDFSPNQSAQKKIKDLEKKYPSIKFLNNEENQGSAEVYNKGISAAHGVYICCLDADDKFERTFVERAVNHFAGDTKLGFVTSWIKIFGESYQIIKTPQFDPAKLLAMDTVAAASMFPKVLWKKIDGFNPEMKSYRDWEFWISLVEAGYEWLTIEEPLIFYRDRRNSSSKLASEKKIALFRKIINKHKMIYQKYMSDIIVEQRLFTEGIMNTKGWKIIDKLRFLRNRFFI